MSPLRLADAAVNVPQVMADVFALQRIQSDVIFRNDDYVAAEKVKAINRLLEHLRMEMRSQVRACPCLMAMLKAPKLTPCISVLLYTACRGFKCSSDFVSVASSVVFSNSRFFAHVKLWKGGTC